MPKQKVTLQALLADRAKGLSLRESAERHSVTFQAVWARLHNAGVNVSRQKPSAKLCANPACDVCFTPRERTHRYCSHRCHGAMVRDTHKPFCIHGHPLSGDNLMPRYGKTPARCRACVLAHQAEYRARKKDEHNA